MSKKSLIEEFEVKPSLVKVEDIDDYDLYEILGEIKDICIDCRNSLSGEDLPKENFNGTICKI